MYRSPFIIENLKKLKEKGIHFIEPKFDENKAKLADIDKIIREVHRILG